MSKIKVAINGFGRIGRLTFRLLQNHPEFEVVALNDLTDSETLAYLLKYDSTQGSFQKDTIKAVENGIIVEGKEIKIYAEKDPENLPWEKHEVDIVMECTGFFRSQELVQKHIIAGAKKVIISAPAKGDVKTIVYNVNHDKLSGEETIISGASCTTNCLAPVVKVLNDAFGIKSAFMTTVHAYTNDQRTLDGPHKKDLRRGRTAAANIIPTTTGAAKATAIVLPELRGKLDGIAIRVPVAAGSLIDLTLRLEENVTVEQINNAIIKAADSYLKNTLGYTNDPIVSQDIVGTSYASLFDLKSTKVVQDGNSQLVKVISWYDNEMSYTSQLVRLTKHFSSLID